MNNERAKERARVRVRRERRGARAAAAVGGRPSEVVRGGWRARRNLRVREAKRKRKRRKLYGASSDVSSSGGEDSEKEEEDVEMANIQKLEHENARKARKKRHSVIQGGLSHKVRPYKRKKSTFPQMDLISEWTL